MQEFNHRMECTMIFFSLLKEVVLNMLLSFKKELVCRLLFIMKGSYMYIRLNVYVSMYVLPIQ